MEGINKVLPGLLKKLKSRAARKGYIALIDQCVVSAATFLTGILLARFLRPIDYGIFVLAYAILLFMNGIQEALVVNPMMVLNASLDGTKLRQYMTSTGLFQLLLGLLIVFLMLGTSVFSRFYYSKSDFALIYPVLAFAIFAFQTQEFFRRMLFARMNFIGGLINDLVSYGLQVTGILWLIYTKSLSIINAFYVIAISFTIAAFFGCFQCRSFLTTKLFLFKDIVKKNWSHGRWLLGSNLTFWVSDQSYLFITAFFLGPIGPAVLKACQNIVAPTHIALQSLENLVPSTASRKLATKGVTDFSNFLNMSKKFILLIVISYVLIVSIFSDFFLKLFYRDKYVGYGIIIILVALRYITSSLNSIKMIGLRVLHKPKSIFVAYLSASILTIIISIPLIKYLGIAGGAAGMLISSIIVLIINVRSFKRFLLKKALSKSNKLNSQNIKL